jgi:hypothetical protein
MKQHDTVSRKVCESLAICVMSTVEKTYTRRSHLHFFDRQLSHAIGLSALAVSTVHYASHISTHHSSCVTQGLCTVNFRTQLSRYEDFLPHVVGCSCQTRATRYTTPPSLLSSPFRSPFIKPAHFSMTLRRGRENVDEAGAR